VILTLTSLQKNEYFAVLRRIKRRKAKCIGHILRRNCLLQQVIEGTRRRGIRYKQLLDDVN
jgi:hypothetical protein